MKIPCTHAMAKRPGVSATSHFIAHKSQHLILYIKSIMNATFFQAICNKTYPIIHGKYSFFNIISMVIFESDLNPHIYKMIKKDG